ncbi:hypothetical protein [Maridesulfovibrio salexigens]|uniref:Uncharacterized protein n=1 Tax=Maridesulfovibrio salexigens (strain ATCC 14822 / DSM 2638 / NCIMB 8403 / VKM B-1763) TaxID=526222 RepID=C6BWI1_MARSD|nr:hypothetical protein [Maridesulfovibrio salexigens]ACS78425.1 conserved hypothetical protein [Maridesulfovibrio salexigens DSM 2638]
MNRREFFSRFVSPKRQGDAKKESVQEQEKTKKTPLTEKELFLRAMAQGIDPATVTPGQLEELVS